MVSEWYWCSTRASLWRFIEISKIFKVNNFVSADFQTQVFIWLLISCKFCTRIINKKGGTNCLNAKMLLPNKRLSSGLWMSQHDQSSKGINMTDKNIEVTQLFDFLKTNINYQNKASGVWKITCKSLAITCKNCSVSPRLKNCGMKNRILEWLNEIIWMKDSTLTRYRIAIFEKTGIIKFETKFIKGISFVTRSISWV